VKHCLYYSCCLWVSSFDSLNARLGMSPDPPSAGGVRPPLTSLLGERHLGLIGFGPDSLQPIYLGYRQKTGPIKLSEVFFFNDLAPRMRNVTRPARGPAPTIDI